MRLLRASLPLILIACLFLNGCTMTMLSPRDTVKIFDDGSYRNIPFEDLLWIKKHSRSGKIMAGFILGLAIDFMYLRHLSLGGSWGQ